MPNKREELKEIMEKEAKSPLLASLIQYLEKYGLLREEVKVRREVTAQLTTAPQNKEAA